MDYIKRGCAAACVAMALSSIGIDMKPWQVCDNNLKSGADPVYMHWENSGTYVKCDSIEAALQNCIDHPGKYAFPIVSMMPGRQHYVLVTGVIRDEEGKITGYMVMNPENQTKDMMKYEELTSTQIIQYFLPEAQ